MSHNSGPSKQETTNTRPFEYVGALTEAGCVVRSEIRVAVPPGIQVRDRDAGRGPARPQQPGEREWSSS